MVFHFYNTFLYSFSTFLLFSGGIIISSTFFQFSSSTGFDFTILAGILLPMNSPVASAVLWTTFWEAVFRASISVLAAVSNNCFPCLLDIFLSNDKNPDPLTYFFVL